MVVNFKAHGISRGARKLTRTPTLNLKKKKGLNLTINSKDNWIR
jgi:hypothetical protein